MGLLTHVHSNPDRVDFRSPAYLEMSVKWELIHALLGGTLAMQEAGEDYLPREEGEELADYRERLGRSVLFNGYGKVIDQLASRPFEEEVKLRGLDELEASAGDAFEFLKMIEDDVDRTGKDLTAFAEEAMRAALTYGFTCALVDFPNMGEAATLGDRRARKLRPTFVHVTPPQILGHRVEEMEDGTERLTMFRYGEEVEVPDGKYGTKRVRRIRVYTPDRWELWESRNSIVADAIHADGVQPSKGPDDSHPSDAYEPVASGPNTLGEVPVVAFYAKRDGYLIGSPPFEDVAQLNKAHWQSTSDHRAYLSFARIGTLALFGFDRDEVGDELRWGRKRYIYTEKGPQEADAKVVEHEGAAIDAGLRDLDKLEQQMESLGNEPLRERLANVTATGEGRDESRSRCRLHSWVRGEEQFIRRCYEWAARWERVEMPPEFGVDVYSDFRLLTAAGTEDFKLLMELRALGVLSSRTVLMEAKRRGMVSDHLDVDDELALVALERAAAGGAGVEDLPSRGTLMETGTTDGHRHVYRVGDPETDEVDGHRHPVGPDGAVGEADGHSHARGSLADEDGDEG